MTKTQENATIRENFATAIGSTLDIANFDFLGRTTEGMAFQDPSGKTVIVKVVVKADTFDLADAFDEYAEKNNARIERELAATQKRLEREAKAQATAEAKAKAEADAKAKAEAKAKKEAVQEDANTEVSADTEVDEEIAQLAEDLAVSWEDAQAEADTQAVTDAVLGETVLQYYSTQTRYSNGKEDGLLNRQTSNGAWVRTPLSSFAIPQGLGVCGIHTTISPNSTVGSAPL